MSTKGRARSGSDVAVDQLPQPARWVPDEEANACMICEKGFSLLNRRHHCRMCGRVLCDDCSSKRAATKDSKKTVRICVQCHSKLVSKVELDRDLSDRTLYETQTVCASCSFIERKGITYIPADVYQSQGLVWLRSDCRVHGKRKVLVCTSSAFFNNMHAFAPATNTTSAAATAAAPPVDGKEGKQPDIEDLLKLSPRSENLPLVAAVHLFRDGLFESTDKVVGEIEAFVTRFPADGCFMLKLVGGLVPAEQIPELNRRLHAVMSSDAVCERQLPVLVDLSFERLIDLSGLDDSVLLRPEVFPMCRYFVVQGGETQCVDELKLLVEAMETISNMQIAVTLVVDRPFPSLKNVLVFLRQSRQTVRFVVISRERSPKQILQNTAVRTHRALSGELGDEGAVDEEGTDPYDLLLAIEVDTRGQGDIRTTDFVPLNMLRIAEPLIKLLGTQRRSFSIRPSPFCGMFTWLVTTKGYESSPLSHLFDLKKLYRKLLPITESMRKDNSIGVWTGNKLLKVFLSAAHPNVELPAFLKNSTDDDFAKNLAEFARNTQMLIIHNNMDVDSVDTRRRCQCASVRMNKDDENGAVSTCLGCL